MVHQNILSHLQDQIERTNFSLVEYSYFLRRVEIVVENRIAHKERNQQHTIEIKDAY